jgi:carbamate kinase
MRIVVALGGNALLRREQPLEAHVQRANVEEAVRSIAELAQEHELVVTHGNGPQVGLLALQSASYGTVGPYPLDVLGAESEGMIGYLLEQALTNALRSRRVATLLTQVIVDPFDPAFDEPSKPIGPVYPEEEARQLADERGWTVAEDGSHFRRVVPSPEPQTIVECETIRLLVEAGVLVVCLGGGGIPVLADQHGALRGVEAVIDKDLSAGLLAAQLEADFLLMLTDIPAVQREWGTPKAQPIRLASPDELRALTFAPGSMRPKVEAACRFVEATGAGAAIGALADAAAIVNGQAGTLIESSTRSARTG